MYNIEPIHHVKVFGCLENDKYAIEYKAWSKNVSSGNHHFHR